MNAIAARAVQNGRFAALAGLALGLLLAACGPGEEAPPPAASGAPAYAQPPRVTEVATAEDGLVVRGLAAPGERVRVLTVDGGAHGAAADEAGAFEVRLPGFDAREARLLGLAGHRGGRPAPAEGWLFVPPGAPDLAVVLRPGAPAASLGAAPLLAALDYDGGTLTVSGRATPGGRVRVWLDGAPGGEGTVAPDGTYGVRLVGVAAPGAHEITVTTPDGRESRTIPLAVGEAGDVMQVRPFDGGWRVTWRMPGGGQQTTYVLRPSDD